MPTPRLPSRNQSPLARTKPAEHLAGSADVAIPGWQDRVRDMVFASSAKHRRAGFQLYVDLRFRALMRAAADARGMRTSAYARRALAAFIAHDLGIEFSQVTSLCPAPEPWHGVHGARARHHGVEPGVDDGTGFGSWQVCDG